MVIKVMMKGCKCKQVVGKHFFEETIFKLSRDASKRPREGITAKSMCKYPEQRLNKCAVGNKLNAEADMSSE